MTYDLATTQTLPAVGTGSIGAYIDAVQRIPVLAREEEAALFERFRDEDDLAAARRIVLAHLRYVVFIARSYAGYGLPLEDLIQQGNVGLMKSVKRFDPSREVRLVSFAVHWIKAEIHEYVLRNWRIVKVATTKAQRKLFFNLRKLRKGIGWMGSDEVQAIAEDLEVKTADVREMETRLGGADESYDLPADPEGTRTSPAVYLSAGADEDPAVLLEEDELKARHLARLEHALEGLDERSLDIVRSRWMREKGASLKELAEKYGVSMERIRQIEKKAFERVRPYILA